MPPPARKRVAAIAVLLTMSAGCSSSSPPSPSAPTAGARPVHTLFDALRQVRDTPKTRARITFDRTAAVKAASGGNDPRSPYFFATGVGSPDLHNSAASIRSAFGFDPGDASYELSAGMTPFVGGVLGGLKLDPVSAKLVALGGVRTTSTMGATFRFRPDQNQNPSDKLGRAVPYVISGLDVVRLRGTDFRFGSGLPQLEAADSSGPSVTSDAAVSSVVHCLGNPLAAVLESKPGPGTPPDLLYFGAGLDGAAGRTPVEQLCVATGSAARASDVAAGLRQTLATGTSRQSGRPWSQLLGSPAVSVVGTTVRLTARTGSGIPGGVLIKALNYEDLPGVLG